MSVFLRSFIYQGCKKCNCDRRHCVQDWGFAMHLKLQSIFAAFFFKSTMLYKVGKKKDFNNITLQVKGTPPPSWNNKGNFHTINASDVFIWWHGSCVYVSVCAYELKKILCLQLAILFILYLAVLFTSSKCALELWSISMDSDRPVSCEKQISFSQ